MLISIWKTDILWMRGNAFECTQSDTYLNMHLNRQMSAYLPNWFVNVQYKVNEMKTSQPAFVEKVFNAIIYIHSILYELIKSHLWPWTTKAVLSRWGIFVAIATNALYGSK